MHLQEAAKFVLSSAGLAAFCLCADHIVFKWEDRWKKLAYGVALRAVTDSLVHGVVGGWCWMNVILVLGEQFTTVRVMQIAACVAMATSIDVDHFIAAKSLSFKVIISCISTTIFQGVVTPICAILRAVTRVTNCECLNSTRTSKLLLTPVTAS